MDSIKLSVTDNTNDSLESGSNMIAEFNQNFLTKSGRIRYDLIDPKIYRMQKRAKCDKKALIHLQKLQFPDKKVSPSKLES